MKRKTFNKWIEFRNAQIVKMARFQIPDNPISSIRQIPDQIRILNSTVFRNHVSGLVPWLTCIQRWTVIVTSDREVELGMSSAVGPISVLYNF